MPPELNYEDAQHLLDPAYETMRQLDEEDGLSATWPSEKAGFIDDRHDQLYVALGHVDDNNVFRNLEALYDPEEEILEVTAETWKDYRTSEDMDIRFKRQAAYEEVENPDVVAGAVQSAYEQSLAIDETELLKTGKTSRGTFGGAEELLPEDAY